MDVIDMNKFQDDYLKQSDMESIADVLDRTSLMMFQRDSLDVDNLFINLAIIELMDETENYDYSDLAVKCFLTKYIGVWRSRFHRKLDKIHAYMLAAEEARAVHKERQHANR
jgi:hypothetical protein